MTSQLLAQSMTHTTDIQPALARLPSAWEKLRAAYPAELKAILDSVTREDDLGEIEAVASHVAAHFKTLVVVGMGGSSLGAEVLAGLSKEKGVRLHVLDNIDPHTVTQLCETICWAETAFLIVSKSGGTIEVHALLGALLDRASQEKLTVAKHFFCLTMGNGNVLEQWARAHGVRVIEHDVALCGRFSIFSAVGLIPAAAMGLDIRGIRASARTALTESGQASGPAAQGAALAATLMGQGITAQVWMHYVDRLEPLARWVRQCWAESLGKEGRGTLMVPSRGVTDQHSQLQLYLDGPKDKYFTTVMVETRGEGPTIGTGFDYLRGARLGDLIMAKQRATNDTLVARGCPLRILTLRDFDAAALGALLMHFTLETLYTAALLGVNPFNQPAVEAGKNQALAYLAGRNSAS